MPPLLALALLLAPAADPADGTAAELDAFWAEVARTVREGDFDGYAALYHRDAVFVDDAKAEAYPIAGALARWRPGFEATKAGRTIADVNFRFTTRLHGDDAAHETGLFRYDAHAPGEPPAPRYVHFEALTVRGPDGWRWLMERQTAPATADEWAAAGR